MTHTCLLLLLLLALALIGFSSADADSEQAVSQAVSPRANNFDGLCQSLGELVPIPVIKSQELCATSGFINDLTACPFLDLTENSLTMLSGGNGSTCLGSSQSPAAETSLRGKRLPFPFSDQRPLPNTLPSQLLASEGASYYWLWKNTLNFERWSGCAATNTPQTVTQGTPVTGNASQDWIVPPGWTVHSTIWQPDGSSDVGLYWPFATVLFKADAILILIRLVIVVSPSWPTAGVQKHWLIGRLVMARFTLQLSTPGKVHKGFADVTANIWPALRSALNKLMANKAGGACIKNIYVAGHSLGAGVATLVSHLVQDYVGSHVRVDAALFAAPNVGDSAYITTYARVVNGRHIRFYNDLIPQVPCTPTMIGCKDALVPTPNPRNNGLWSYAPIPGNLVLLPSGMPQQAEAWSLLDKIYPCEAGRFLRATHTCSYNCFLSQYVSDSNNLCQLWSVPEGSAASGSYCYAFPVKDGPQYPYKF